jgi:hypothetical protein
MDVEDDESSTAWNVDFIAAIYTVDLQKPLDLEKISKNIEKEMNRGTTTSQYSAAFIPWKEIILFNDIDNKEEEKTALRKLDFEVLRDYVKKIMDSDKVDVKERIYAYRFIEKHKLFITAIGSQKISLDPHYINSRKFIRIKLSNNIRIQFLEPLGWLKELTAEVNLLIHKSGIVIVTLYIQPLSEKILNTEQIIEIERRLQDEKIKINNNPNPEKLEEFLLNKLKDIFRNDLKKIKNNPYLIGPRYVICIRATTLLTFKRVKLEIYGILNGMRGWRTLNEKKVKLKELYKQRDFYIFNGNLASIFLGSSRLENHINNNKEVFKKNPMRYGSLQFLYIFPEYLEHYVLTPNEFLSIINGITERYTRRILEVARDYSRSPEVVERFFEDSQEYSNIAFMRARVIWEIMKDGVEKLGVGEKMKLIEAEMSILIRAIQQDAQIRIAIVFGILGVSSVGGLIWQVTHNSWNVITGVFITLLLCIAIIGPRAIASILARTVCLTLRKNRC